MRAESGPSRWWRRKGGPEQFVVHAGEPGIQRVTSNQQATKAVPKLAINEEGFVTLS
jgi:hypothetical protein